MADTLLFMLVSQKTHPLQTLPGWQCNVRQSPTNSGRHRLWPVRQHALRDRGQAPERDARRVAHRPLAGEGTPDVAIDGTERRRQRPTDATQHKAHDRGKKTTPTDKHIVLVNDTTSTVIALGPTVVSPIWLRASNAPLKRSISVRSPEMISVRSRVLLR